MNTSPLWLTLLVELGAGVLGTLISTMMRISHDREANLRTRMLKAADDFGAAVTLAIDMTRQLRIEQLQLRLQGSFDHFALRERVVRWGIPEARRRVSKGARVRLLFGPRSATAKAAERVSNGLRQDLGAVLVPPPVPDLRETGTQAEVAINVVEALDDFSDSARSDLRSRSMFRRK